MTIIVYQCDTCKREIEKIQNRKGLEVINRCTITQGCRGKLYQTKVLPDFIRNSLPNDVTGLTNWSPRKVLLNHTQTIEKDVWVIELEPGMGTAPIVSVFVNRPTNTDSNNQEEITPSTISYTVDTVTLTFDRPWSGIAQLVSRQSAPTILSTTVTQTDTSSDYVQISNNGEITIATRVTSDDNNSLVGISMTFDSATGTDITSNYVADNQPSTNSAWVDYNKVIIKGKIYNVRSFSGLTSEMVTGTINNGSTFLFDGIDWNGADSDTTYETLQKEEAIILLSSEPHESIDKIFDKFIDVSLVTADSNQFGFHYNDGEFFADPSIVQTLYPLIRKV